jgi:hypothetical protein
MMRQLATTIKKVIKWNANGCSSIPEFRFIPKIEPTQAANVTPRVAISM